MSYIEKESIFTIQCQDVYLKEYEMKDLDAIYRLTLQPEITDFLPDWIATREQRKEWMEKYELPENKMIIESLPSIPNVSRCALRLGIMLKETDELIGWITSGLKDELPPPNREIGYAISKDYRGKGYTTQAANGLIQFLFEQTDTDVINTVALTHNIPSNRVIQKCGFKFVGVVVIDNEDYSHYTLTKNEWVNRS